MKTVALLVIVLSNRGYWFGDQAVQISLHRAVAHAPEKALVQWELTALGATIDRGVVDLGDDETIIHLRAPKVRARTRLTWSYRLIQSDHDKPLESGSAAVEVFPTDLLDGLPRQVGDKTLTIVAKPEDSLAAALKVANVPIDVVDDLSSLQTRDPAIVIVAEGVVGDSAFEQAPLLSLARSGRSVMVLRQTKPRELAGYALASRQIVKDMTWLPTHPLLREFEPHDLATGWFRSGDDGLAMHLPAGEPALAIVCWPDETTQNAAPAASDALLVTKALGAGRMVLCQIPLRDFRTDPLNVLFLRNAVEYLLTPPEPTPQAGIRVGASRSAPAASSRTILIPSGAHP